MLRFAHAVAYKFSVANAHCLAIIVALSCATGAVSAAEASHDIVVYGGASGGVVAAVQAARSGHSVILISPTQKLGGLTAAGLGQTDTAGYREIIGGLAREFYQRIRQHYSEPSNWHWGDREAYMKKVGPGAARDGMMFNFEPHVAEKVFEVVAVCGLEVAQRLLQRRALAHLGLQRLLQ